MRFSDPRRLLISTVALLCVLQAVAGAGIVAGASTTGVAGAAEASQTTPTPTNNTTIQQENPDEVDESGDTDAVRSRLAESLAERLGESSIRISEGEYEQGQSVLGDEYDSTLAKYVDVAGETDGESGEEFEQAAEAQRQFGATAQEYNETYRAYQEARQNGNETRARELARELNRLADDANESSRRLSDSYTGVENETGANLSAAQASATNVSNEIDQQHETVISETFVRTSLSVTTAADRTSFAEPAGVDGRLTLENGTALGNESVEIRIGDRVETVRTDGDGRFTVDYRPVTVANGTTNVSVAFLPAGRSVYLGANATLNVTITATNATLSVDGTPERAAFGENVTVGGRAHVDGTAVEGARVRVRVDGVTLGTVRTAENGSYRLSATLPASIASGEQSVDATIVPADSAVRSDVATATLRVASTDTDLSIDATRENDTQVRLTGRLVTADGTPVAGQTVELRLNGTTVATAETRADGTFERVVTPRSGLTGTATVEAVYDAPSSNLAGATAESNVDLDADEADADAGPFSVELLAGGGAVVLSVLVGGWLVRRDGESAPVGGSRTPATAATAVSDEPASGNSGVDAAETVSALLDDDESAAAIRALYSGVRQSLAVGDGSQTHWEFYAAASEQLRPEAAGALERLTEAYERVVYSPDGVEAERADDLLDDAGSLLGEGDDGSAP